MEILLELNPILIPDCLKGISLNRLIFRRMAVGILVTIFFISFLFSCTPVAQQKKQGELVEDLLSVTFPTENDGWTCGRWGTVLHTADGGKSWVRQKTGTEYTLSSIFFVDSKNGWAVGNEGTIIHTPDGGKTWEKQKSPVSFFLMKVYFETPLKGWIVTEQTHILHTNDGGKTWTIKFKDEDFILKSISFCDTLHGWVVGEYGYIYHTADGGVSWKKQAGAGRNAQSARMCSLSIPVVLLTRHVPSPTERCRSWLKASTAARCCSLPVASPNALARRCARLCLGWTASWARGSGPRLCPVWRDCSVWSRVRQCVPQVKHPSSALCAAGRRVPALT